MKHTDEVKCPFYQKKRGEWLKCDYGTLKFGDRETMVIHYDDYCCRDYKNCYYYKQTNERYNYTSL